MALLTIVAHPYQGSLSHAVAEALSEPPENDLIDLYRERFEPVLSAPELRDYLKDTPPDAPVQTMQRRLERASSLALVFPVWWGGPPAIMKGFFDRVLLPLWAFTVEEDGAVAGTLEWIDRVHVWCSLDAPDRAYAERTVTAMQQILGETTFSFCGIDPARVEWHVLQSISATTAEERAAWIEAARDTGLRPED